MDKIPFEDGTKIKNATVTVNEQEYEVTPAQYSGTTPMSAFNLNKMQDNIEKAIPVTDTVKVSATEPEQKSDVWIQHGKNLFDENSCFIGTGILGNGQEYSNSQWNSSNYIPIKENSTICFSYETIGNGILSISEYDNNKSFIKMSYKDFASNFDNKIVTSTTSNTKFVRLSYRNDFGNEKFQLEYGTTRTSYEKYVNNDIFVNDNGVYNSVLNKNLIELGIANNIDINKSGWTALNLIPKKFKGITINENGQISIGKNVKKIEINFSINASLTSQSDYFQLGINFIKNNDWDNFDIGSFSEGRQLISASVSGLIYNVQEGDILYVNVFSNLSSYSVIKLRTFGNIKILN